MKICNSNNNPDKRIKKHTAYKIIKKNSVKSPCRTDACGICEGDGQIHTPRQIATHEEHLKLAELQRRGYNLFVNNPPVDLCSFIF
jgi:hypothetical protein